MSDNKNELVFNYDKDLPQVGELKRKYLQDKVIELSKIPQPVQKSEEWYTMRETMITASDWGAILGDSTYDDGTEVLLGKCGKEKKFPQAAMNAMDWGNKYEDVAVLVYKHRNNVDVWDFGCIRHPFFSFLGASPDGITPDGVMLEIKCPSRRIIDGITPPYYWCQVQGQLEVCDLDRCDFLECNFKEYESESEYLSDNFQGNDKLNIFGNEKGVNAEFYKKDDPTRKKFYQYSGVSLLGDELENWKKSIKAKYESDSNIIFDCFSYWYLKDVSCVPIYRNHIWFHQSKPILETFWNLVLKYRSLGLTKLTEDIVLKKAIKKSQRDEKRDAKKKEADEKKYKKIRDFISLDDDTTLNNFSKKITNVPSDSDDDDDFSILSTANSGKSFFR